MNIHATLFNLRENAYAEFQAKLIPNIHRETILGIRVPKLRAFAKACITAPEAQEFIQILPHSYLEEYMLHSFIIAETKDFRACIEQTERLLPYIDNWAVCDSFNPRIFKKHPDALINKVIDWANSSHTYTSRFGIKTLMNHYLDSNFKPEYLEIPMKIHSDEYYLNMMIALFYATALAKQWDSTIPYLEKHLLSPWIHQKTIQKAIESYRITDEQKAFLRTLKINSR